MKITPEQIKAWVSSHFKFKGRSRGRQLAICNPFDDDKKFHFWINLEYTQTKKTKRWGYWVHDFRPGHQTWDGSFVKFVQKHKNITYYQALKEITGSNRSAREVLRAARLQAQEIEEEDDDPEDCLLTMPPNSKLFRDREDTIARRLATSYLLNRGLTEEQIIGNYLYYTPSSIVFPYLEYGIVVYWQERSFLNKSFLFPNEVETGLAKTDFIYGFDDVEPGDYVIITEAIMDKISVGDNCVATGGADFSYSRSKQVRKLRALSPRQVILAPDNDDAGLTSLRANRKILETYFEICYCLPPRMHGQEDEFKDWNRYDQEFGSGWSRRYIEQNVRRLNTKSMIRPWIGAVNAA